MADKVTIDVDETKLLYSAGFTSAAIGQLQGCSHNIVIRTLREAGVFIRPRHWKGGTIVSGGYAYVKYPGHPLANQRGYVMRAVVNWEKANRRPFPVGKFPHHDNEVPLDDRPENIVPVTRAEHARLHMKRRHENDRQSRRGNQVQDNGVDKEQWHQDGACGQADTGSPGL